MQVELKVIGGKQDGKLIPLTGGKFLIGREKDCHLRPNSDLVSRHHCVFTKDNYGVRLRDLGSTNGTFVNGERLFGQKLLVAGDQVQVGKLSFEVQLREASATEKSAVPAASPEVDAPSDSTFELAVEPLAQSQTTPTGVYGGDTMVIPAYQPPAEVLGQPMNPPGQTALMQQPGAYGAMPPVAYAPGQVAYPGYTMVPAGAYMPGMAMHPGMIPAMMQPGFQQMQPSPMPQPAQAAQPRQSAATVLPPPEETGYREPVPAAAALPSPAAANATGAPQGVPPSTAAADIIKQYMQRRPT